jgi:hypothetical protein
VKRRLSPPTGQPPPARATGPNGTELDLVTVARSACEKYDLEFPDERERYGPAGMDWCRHDNQHLLNWAVLSLTAGVDYERELAWLARVLEARDFPLPRLVRGLELLAEACSSIYPTETAVADRVRSGAAFVASRPTFLT